MKVLVACEESQRVCKEFRKRGHDAYSCDIVSCTGGHPEWHIKGDVIPILDGGCRFDTQDGSEHYISGQWDLIIAHPPCTYLTNGGAVRMFRKEIREYPPYGTFQMVNVERLKKGIVARDFFMKCLNANCERVAVENPVPMSIYMLPKASQAIQPYDFGDAYSKRTYLWIRGLPPLMPTEVLANKQPYINGGGGSARKTKLQGRNLCIR